jgi:hypothetical protein
MLNKIIKKLLSYFTVLYFRHDPDIEKIEISCIHSDDPKVLYEAVFSVVFSKDHASKKEVLTERLKLS